MSPSSSARRSPVADMTGKIRRKRRQRLRRRLLVGLVVALVLALVAGAVWLVLFSQLLAAKAVRVKGTSLLTVETVTSTAQVPLGLPLARQPVAAIGDRVRTLPQVADVAVHRAWPDTVEIVVSERQAVYVLHTPATGLRLVDATGAAYQPVPEAPAGLPAAELADDAPDRLRADIATVVAALTPELRAARVEAATPDAITLVLPDGRSVVMGSAEQADTKVKVATQLMAARPAQVYDVSAPGRPVTR